MYRTWFEIHKWIDWWLFHAQELIYGHTILDLRCGVPAVPLFKNEQLFCSAHMTICWLKFWTTFHALNMNNSGMECGGRSQSALGILYGESRNTLHCVVDAGSCTLVFRCGLSGCHAGHIKLMSRAHSVRRKIENLLWVWQWPSSAAYNRSHLKMPFIFINQCDGFYAKLTTCVDHTHICTCSYRTKWWWRTTNGSQKSEYFHFTLRNDNIVMY